VEVELLTPAASARKLFSVVVLPAHDQPRSPSLFAGFRCAIDRPVRLPNSPPSSTPLRQQKLGSSVRYGGGRFSLVSDVALAFTVLLFIGRHVFGPNIPNRLAHSTARSIFVNNQMN
jgi:hypothetical protein